MLDVVTGMLKNSDVASLTFYILACHSQKKVTVVE